MSWTKEDLAAHMSKLTKRRVDHAIQPGYVKGARGRRPRSIPGTMNKTEAAYAQHLELQQRAGAIHFYGFEAMTFKLAHDCRYTPDFIVMMADGSIRCIDTKGTRTSKATGASTYFAEDDSKVKIRVAARTFPFFEWVYAFKDKRTGEWTEVIFGET